MNEPPDPDCISELIRSATQKLMTHSDNPRLEAELLLAKASGKDRAFFRAFGEKTFTEEQRQLFLDLTEKRADGHPVAYLLGFRDFWRHRFDVSPDVLIPRPETETLIEAILNKIQGEAQPRILDLGTGSGIIAISIALECPKAHIVATDLSPQALGMAMSNARKLGCSDNIRFLEGHWFKALKTQQQFDIIASNPPYIATTDLHLEQGDLRFEPRMALASGTDGLNDILEIAGNAGAFLKPKGTFMLEHGYDQAHPVRSILEARNYVNICSLKDLQGHSRVTTANLARPIAKVP